MSCGVAARQGFVSDIPTATQTQKHQPTGRKDMTNSCKGSATTKRLRKTRSCPAGTIPPITLDGKASLRCQLAMDVCPCVHPCPARIYCPSSISVQGKTMRVVLVKSDPKAREKPC